MRNWRPLAWLAIIVGALLTLSWLGRWIRIMLWQVQATLGPLLLIAGIIALVVMSGKRRVRRAAQRQRLR